jgi:hypothetical protein
MAVKYIEIFNEMVAKYEKEFDAFQEVHNRYMTDPRKHQEEFNREGSKIMDIVREYEDRLCGKMEKTANANYSAGLSEKFRNEIKKYLPKLDMIGVTIL